MEVHFTAEQDAQLTQIARTTGTDPEDVVKDAVLNLLQQDARFRAAVQEGITQADRGEFIDEDEMKARFEQMLQIPDVRSIGLLHASLAWAVKTCSGVKLQTR